MKYLNKKFWRDILGLWSEFISVFIMVVLSVAIYAGMSAVWTGMKQSYQTYKSDTNLADAYITGTNIQTDAINRIKALPYVSEAQQSMLIKCNVRNQNTDSDLYVYSFQDDTYRVMNPMVRKGEKPDTLQKGLWLDEDYAKAHTLNTGDFIDIDVNGIKQKAKILGTVLDAENIYFVTSYTETVPDHKRHGYAYMNENYLKSSFGGISYNQVRIKLSDPMVSKNKLKKDVKQAMGASFYGITMKEDKASITQAEQEVDQIKKMAVLFSAVFILLSILSIYTTMSRLIRNQIIQIGTLKSLGFYNRHIFFHYGMYGLLVALLGSVGGLALGFTVVANLVMKIKQATLTLPAWSKVIGVDSILLMVALVVVCTLASIITTRKVAKNIPALTIRGEIEKKKENTKKYKRSILPYDWLWTFRSIRTHPIRTAMSVIAVSGSVVLMTAGIGVWDSLSASNDKVFEEEYRYRYVGVVSGMSDDELSGRFESKDVQLSKIESADFRYNHQKMEGTLSILASGKLIHLFNKDTGELIHLEREKAVVSAQMATTMNLHVGENITYLPTDSGKTNKIQITAITDAKMPQGLFISSEQVENFIPNTIYIANEKAYKQAKTYKSINNLMSIQEQKNNMKEMMDSVHSIMYILILASFILSVVILYNLGILSCLERYREYATMKVIGFYDKEINGLVFKESLIDLIVGLLIGIPLSKQFLTLYIHVVARDGMEWTPMIIDFHFAIILGTVAVFSLVINLVVCNKIKHINMVEALKSVE